MLEAAALIVLGQHSLATALTYDLRQDCTFGIGKIEKVTDVNKECAVPSSNARRSCNKLQDDPLRSPQVSSGQHRMWITNGHMVEFRSFNGIDGTNPSKASKSCQENVKEKKRPLRSSLKCSSPGHRRLQKGRNGNRYLDPSSFGWKQASRKWSPR